MRTSQLYEIEIYCREITNGTRDMVKWEWDDKFMTIQTKIGKKEKANLFAVLKKSFQSHWNHRTIKRAPEPIVRITEALGGVKEGQYLFFSDPSLDIMIYGAWWPWATKDKFTIRLGIITENISEDDEASLKRLFRTWFGL